MHAVVAFGRALALCRAARGFEVALQVKQPPLGGLALDREPFGECARLAHPTLRLAQFFEGARARLGLALESGERFAQLLDARAGRLVFFDRRVVARELRLGPGDATARFRRALVA